MEEKELAPQSSNTHIEKQQQSTMGSIKEGNFFLDWLEKLNEIIKKYGVWAIIRSVLVGVISALLIIIIYDVYKQDIIGRYIEVKATEIELNHNNGNKARSEINPKINKILRQLMKDLDADRVTVMEYHNGKENSTNLPFMYADMTYEEIQYDAMYLAEDYLNLNLNMYPIASYIAQNGFYSGPVEDLKKIDKRWASRLEGNNTEYLIMMQIHTPHTEIGYLTISYQDRARRDALDTRTVYVKMANAVQDLNVLLDFSQSRYYNKHNNK